MLSQTPSNNPSPSEDHDPNNPSTQTVIELAKSYGSRALGVALKMNHEEKVSEALSSNLYWLKKEKSGAKLFSPNLRPEDDKGYGVIAAKVDGELVPIGIALFVTHTSFNKKDEKAWKILPLSLIHI